MTRGPRWPVASAWPGHCLDLDLDLWGFQRNRAAVDGAGRVLTRALWASGTRQLALLNSGRAGNFCPPVPPMANPMLRPQGSPVHVHLNRASKGQVKGSTSSQQPIHPQGHVHMKHHPKVGSQSPIPGQQGRVCGDHRETRLYLPSGAADLQPHRAGQQTDPSRLSSSPSGFGAPISRLSSRFLLQAVRLVASGYQTES
ncbi:hypothetical protein VTJ04DRAFT_2821 [Mycothermus thermophilus]|uniref:uncharacterized protein n=1 Tax=Humicola insolens TaxID=85995 RepID=UPI0037448C50